MIHITQGHEKSVSTEVLIKSLIKFSQDELNKIILHYSKDSITKNLELLNIDFNIENNTLTVLDKDLRLNLIPNTDLSESMESLVQAQDVISSKDILITMPTSKDQFKDSKQTYNGHTDYFRKNINQDATMLFKYKNTYCLLLSDHIPLNEVPHISTNDFQKKLSLSLDSLINKFKFSGEIYIAGMNPHAGEDGLIGAEEKKFNSILQDFSNQYSFTKDSFLPADTIHYLHNNNKEQLFIYFYHDQALTFFKNTFGLFGINITLNLPFLRFSVDHGTAFDLYSKDSANFLGTYYVLNEALKIHG